MTKNTITVEGTLDADGMTVQLESKVALPPGRVTVSMQPTMAKAGTGPTIVEVLDRIHRERQAQGRRPMTEEEMAAEISQMRDDEEYEERCRQIWAQTGNQ